MFLPILSGVPQGSRPMLYFISVDDLSHSIKYSHTQIFADNIKCILPIASCQDSINLQNISIKYYIGVLNGNSYQEIYTPNILTQYNSSIYISKLKKLQILQLY